MRLRSGHSHWQKFVLLYGAILTCTFTVISIFPPTFLSLVGLKVYDSMLHSLPQRVDGVQPVIIDIDEQALAEFGQWPWPRYRIALLLDTLNELGASAIGLDMIFAEEDRTSLKILQQELRRDLGVEMSFSGLSDSLGNYDHVLARSLGQGPCVLGYKFFFDDQLSSDNELSHPLRLFVQGSETLPADLPLYRAKGVTANVAVLASAVQASGFLNYPADKDGVLRRVPLLIGYQEKVYPGFALAVVMRALQTKNVFLNMEGNNLESLIFNGRKIPVDNKSNLLVAYQGKKKFFDYIPATDVLSKVVAKDRIENKIVLLGTSAVGLQDTQATPLDPLYPGVEVHATIVENIINGHFYQKPFWSRGAEVATVIVFGAVSTLLLARTAPVMSIISLFLFCVASWYGSYLFLDKKGIFLNPLFAILIVVINFSLLSLFKYWREEIKTRKHDRDLILAQDTTILSMTALAETRDSETGGHILRTQHYVRLLAEHLASHPRFAAELDNETIELLYRSSPLHDIGKVGVRDSILLNPDRLSEEEFEAMKEHTRLGRDALVKAESRLEDEGGQSFLRIARDIAYAHHEKWDGTGYPRGAKGTAIPMAGRLMALADVYDALVSRRRYKPAFTHQRAMEIICKERGAHFDPDVVDAFLACETDFQQIAQKFVDE